MTTWMISGALGFVAGGAAVWFGREPITLWYKGVENVIGDLNDKVRTLKEKL